MKTSRLLIAVLLVALLCMPACLPKAADCKQPNVFCVGLATTNGGQINDRSYNQAAWEGIQQAKASGLVDWAGVIQTVDARDYDANIAVFANAGYDVVVTVGSAVGDSTRIAAKTYPNTYFIGLDQDQSANQNFSSNLAGLVFPEDQIGFLAGALAAWMSKTRQVGAICGSDALPAMKHYGAGFLAGTAYADPGIKATVIYHNTVGLDQSLNDPAWGAAQANMLIDTGDDIIFGVGGDTGNNALVAAASRGAYAIGADTDQYNAQPVAAPHLYASVVKLIAPAIADLIKAARGAQDGTASFPNGNYLGQVGLSPYHDMDSSIPSDTKLRLSQLNQALVSGKIQTGVSATGQ